MSFSYEGNTCMHPHVFLQGIIVVAGLFTDPAHKVGHLGVGRHVGPQGRLPPEGLLANLAGEGPLSGVGDEVGLEVVFVGKQFITKVALVQRLSVGRFRNSPHLQLGSVDERLPLHHGVVGAVAGGVADQLRLL